MNPTPATSAPTAQHHANLASFLAILERLGIIALTLAPAVAAPFVKNPESAAILAAETPIASALASALQASLAPASAQTPAGVA
jgi:hypothetical protein